jgi:hypothetical protein
VFENGCRWVYRYLDSHPIDSRTYAPIRPAHDSDDDTIMTPHSNQYVFMGGFLLAVVLLYLFQVGRRMKALLAVKIRRLIYGMIILVVVANVLRGYCGYSPNAATILALIPAMLPLWFIKRPRLTRYIPPHVKRKVLDRDLVLADEDQEMHLDHIVPLSKGGDSSVQNLRLISKKKNLKKGAKMPRPWDFV